MSNTFLTKEQRENFLLPLKANAAALATFFLCYSAVQDDGSLNEWYKLSAFFFFVGIVSSFAVISMIHDADMVNRHAAAEWYSRPKDSQAFKVFRKALDALNSKFSFALLMFELSAIFFTVGLAIAMLVLFFE